MKLHQGIDIVSVERIRQILQNQGARFAARVFSASERRYCESKKMKYEHYAARFAAKEAVIKALSATGRKTPPDLCDIEVRHQATGRPFIRLAAKASAKLKLPKGFQWELSLAHERQYAMAAVLLILP